MNTQSNMLSRSWPVMPLKYLATLVTGSTPPKSDAANYEQNGIPWIKPDDLNGLIPVETSEECLSAVGESISRVVPAGSALVCCIGTVGKIGVAGTRLATNQQINSVVFDHPKILSARFGVYALMSSEQEHIRCANKVVVAILNKSGQGNIPIPAPPIPDQSRIASYLDEQTAKIDRLMEMRRQQMALLKEQRAALIQQAVTRGLNPDAPMKDSGLPWLGEVPAHWEVKRNKFLFREIDSRSTTGAEELLTVSHITGITSRNDKEDVTMFLAESNEGYKLCEIGDLVINTMWAFMGALGFSTLRGIVSPSYNVYRLKKSAIPTYYDYLFRSPRFITEIRRYSKGIWDSRLRLYPDSFFEIRSPYPPPEEQAQIVEYIATATHRTEAALSFYARQLEVLTART
ncbi:MAG: Restriction modification system DNA specificity domain [Gallionellaceae bacterium]|nr:MAG: Restriction modification system DNA specificity domain [Gallionellaceae bacterium]